MYPVNDLKTGVIYCEDNLERMGRLPPDSVDLIYLDPPFFSNRDYEVIWGDEAEMRSFEDRWTGGMNYYVRWMRDRVREMHRVLKPTGSVFLHCDWHASRYLGVMADGIFGLSNFRSEIIWKRTSAHSSAKRPGPVHDTLLFYTKSGRYTWNQLYQPYTDDYVETFFDQTDPDGRRWKRSDLTGAGTRNGETGRSWRGIDVTAKGRHWGRPPRELDELDAEGRIHWPKKSGGMPRLKQYPEDLPGVPLQDVWTDIRPLHNLAAERLGYPTQKPEALLERIVGMGSNRGDVILDPFCGCGTTLAVAQRMGRRWIGIDVSPTAVEIMRARLKKLGAEDVVVVGEPDSEAKLRELKPFEFQNWVIRRVDGTHSPRKTGDMGIDGFSFLDRLPIQIKRSERVGRPVVDNFETAVERYGAEKGYIVAFSFTKGAYDEAARVEAAKGLRVELVTVRELLLGTSPLVAPILNRRVFEMPLPRARPKSSLPSAEELVASDQHSDEVA